jgi:hypothetical protein
MYAKIINNVVTHFPYSMADLYRDNPNTSFPTTLTTDTLLAFNVHKVIQTPVISVDSKTHRPIQSLQQIDGVWTQQWVAQQLPESAAADNVRGFRDAQLVKSDWTQVADAPVDKAAWATYRQELRDITQQAGFPWDVQWPQIPVE